MRRFRVHERHDETGAESRGTSLAARAHSKRCTAIITVKRLAFDLFADFPASAALSASDSDENRTSGAKGPAQADV